MKINLEAHRFALNQQSLRKLALSHYAHQPLEEIRSSEQVQVRDERLQSIFAKPRGLWVSVDGPDDWPDACDSRRLGRHQYRIHFAASARVLMVEDIAAMRAFQGQYGRVYDLFGLVKEYWIDWCAVASHYDAIIIAPYQDAYLFEMPWYGGWDCASGCIWNANAIGCVEAIEAGTMNHDRN